MSLLKLPSELLLLVVGEPCLSRADARAMRLVCKLLESAVSPLLFRQIYISKLKRHRDAFLGIAGHPRLAAFPKELVWYELAQDCHVIPTSLARHGPTWPTSLGRHIPTWSRQNDSIDIEGLVSEMVKSVFEALWWQGLEEHGKGLDFLSLFYSSLDAMPHIRSFVSRPMPPGLIISTSTITSQWAGRLGSTHSPPLYEVPAHLLQHPLTVGQDANYTFNDGLRHFLLPAMARSGSQITSLRWADEATEPGLTGFPIADGESFKRLTLIDLCLNDLLHPSTYLSGPPYRRTFNKPTALVDNLSTSLRCASGLKELALCREKGGWIEDPSDRTKTLLTRLLFDGNPHWPKLTTLRLTDMWCANDSFVKFLHIHAATLSRLDLFECGINGAVVRRMALIPRLNLESFHVRNGIDDALPVSEKALLRYINKETQDCPLATDEQFETDDYVWDTHDFPAAAFFDMHSCEELYDREAIAGVDEWLQENDLTDHYPSNGLYELERELADSQDGNNKTFTVQQVYDADMRNETRSENAVRWRWGREQKDGTVFTWPTEDETGHPTVIWRFSRKDKSGELWHGHGDDPLEYWSDWDSVAGDDEMHAEPTPCCESLDTFYFRQNELGDEVPKSAKEYVPSLHPVDQGCTRYKNGWEGCFESPE